MQLTKLNQEKKTREQTQARVYALTTDVKSGEVITGDKIKATVADFDIAPKDAISNADITEYTVAKVDLAAGTVLSKGLISESEEITTNDLRKQEYNVISLPTDLLDGEYIDVRLRLPSGQDFIVVSKKSVTIPDVEGTKSTTAIVMNLSEDEIITMSNAIVENYIVEGSLLYATRYVEPGLQQVAKTTYVPSGAVQQLIYSNENIVTEAKNALISRYNDNVNMREYINANVSNFSEDSFDRITTGTKAEVESSRTLRETYLQSLGGAE